jgi:subtilisin-like proprotein convertase family protein
MTHFSRLTLVAFITVFFVAGAQAQTLTNTFNFTVTSSNVPDGNPVGLVNSGSISGVDGYITNLQVNLNITGGFNGDLYAYLAGPQGGFAVLLNRSGLTGLNPFGYANTGFSITLEDGNSNIHNYQTAGYSVNGNGQVLGTWAPDGRNIDPQSSGSAFDSASTSAGLLNAFNNTIPNGSWTLFIADLSGGGGQSVLVSWGLTVVTVPEPQTWAMLAGGVGMLVLFRRRKNS